MIYVIRHGERADDVLPLDQQTFNQLDPPLTQKGINQSYQTGIFISKFSSAIKNYLIVSSPFQRCVETAIQIKAGLENQPQIKIETNSVNIQNGIGEMLHPSWFKQNVIKELNIYKNRNAIQNVDKCKLGFEYFDEQFIQQQYPENFGEFYQRFFYNYKLLVATFIEKYGTNVALIIVTHGYGVQVSLQNHLAMKKVSDANYNCINLFEFDRQDQQKYRTLLKLYDSHLKESKL